MNNSLVRVLGAIFGVPIVALALIAMFNGKAAEKWPVAEGIVKVSSPLRSFRSKSLDLQVAYQVNGTSYSCSRIEYGQTPNARDRYRYYQGAAVRVFYSPSNPGECILEPGVSFAMMIEFFLGLGLLALGQIAHQRLQLSNPLNPRKILEESLSLDQVHELATSGKLIEAIKAYRTLTGKGLRESKEYVESYLKSMTPY